MEAQTNVPRSQARIFTPIIDQHASWIAANPLQGCPKSCTYCFLNQRGQTRVAPVRLASPAETVAELLSSELYGPERAVALFTWTDVMAIASSRAYLADLLNAFVRQQLPNPVVLITKCRIPTDTIDAINQARESGLRVIVYLSYSGLDAAVELGIRHKQIVANFPVLADAGIPIVHYWRPPFPESATQMTMTKVLDVAAKYATCTMTAGLKVEEEAVERLAGLWPALATTPGVTEAEGVYPQAFWEFIHQTASRYPGYPVFHTNSCALAYVLSEPDRFGIFNGLTCVKRNRCPDVQRTRCRVAVSTRSTTTDAGIAARLARRGLAGTRFTYRSDERMVTIHGVVPNRIASALTQDLGIRVISDGQGDDAYWSSGTSGARPLVIGEQQ